MEGFSDPVVLARLQFAITALFHIVWPVLSIGLSLFLVVLEVLWRKTGDLDYYHHARFWSRLFLLNFMVGVVTGLPLQFEFGTNWAPFANAAGGFFGSVLGFEASMAFMLEAGFLGIMAFGWQRVTPTVHLFSTVMVALGASLSAFWIMSANAWMQTPAGGGMAAGRFVISSYFDAIFNPNMPWAVSHMWLACLETSFFVVGGISAWYVLRGVAVDFFIKSLKLAVLGVAIVTPLQVLVGHGSGVAMFAQQPVKAAAIEAHWQTNEAGQGAAWSVVAWPDKQAQANTWSIDVPDVLSLLATGRVDGQVKGLRDVAPADQPPALPLLYYAFRLMVLLGVLLMALAAWSVGAWWRGRLTSTGITAQRRLLQCWVAAIPLGYVAVECGWIVREVGRQPWVMYGLLRTSEAASPLPAGVLATSLSGYVLLYLGLLVAFLIFARRILYRGPDFSLQPRPWGSTQGGAP